MEKEENGYPILAGAGWMEKLGRLSLTSGCPTPELARVHLLEGWRPSGQKLNWRDGSMSKVYFKP